MSSVWIVFEDGGYDSDTIYQIFDNSTAAHEYADSLSDDDRYYVEEHEVVSGTPKRVERWIGRARRDQRGWRAVEPTVKAYSVWEFENGELTYDSTDLYAVVDGPDRDAVETLLGELIAERVAAENELLERARARREAADARRKAENARKRR